MPNSGARRAVVPGTAVEEETITSRQEACLPGRAQLFPYVGERSRRQSGRLRQPSTIRLGNEEQ